MFGYYVSDLQSDVSISNGEVTGSLSYISTGDLATHWGAGNFIALKLTCSDWSKYTSVLVGMEPSEGSGLVEILTDDQKNGAFKVTNKATQRFKVVATDGTYSNVQYFDLSGLTVASS